MHAFWYGTAWKEDRTEALVTLALQAGFRAIDTANQRKHYYEAGVGAALAKVGIPRDQLFLQTKFTHLPGQDQRLPYDPKAPVTAQVQQSFESSLEHLQTDYVDSLVLHGPSAQYGLAPQDVEAWRAMEGLCESGRARRIGISNVSTDQLEQLCSLARIAPSFVQNRCYATTGWDAHTRSVCRARGIGYQGFSLLTANRSLLQRPLVDAIMTRAGMTREQVVFAFAMQVGMIPLTGTSSAEHMQADLAVLGKQLSDQDVRAIEAIATS